MIVNSSETLASSTRLKAAASLGLRVGRMCTRAITLLADYQYDLAPSAAKALDRQAGMFTFVVFLHGSHGSANAAGVPEHMAGRGR